MLAVSPAAAMADASPATLDIDVARLARSGAHTDCPALALARRLGETHRNCNRLDEASFHAGEEKFRIERSREVHFMRLMRQEALIRALAVTPVISLQGALAKLVVFAELANSEIESPADGYAAKENRFILLSLSGDACRFLADAGLGEDSLGLQDYRSAYLDPDAVCADAEQLIGAGEAEH